MYELLRPGFGGILNKLFRGADNAGPPEKKKQKRWLTKSKQRGKI